MYRLLVALQRRRAIAAAAAILALVAAAIVVSVAGDGKEAPVPAKDDRKSWAGEKPAPEFPAGLGWLNTDRPLRLEDLHGRIVLLDFWTLGCINCQHIVPDLKRLEAEFADILVVIGVHSGKYDAEHDLESIRQATLRLGVAHPVVNDPEFAVWRRYNVNAWPTTALIDPLGNLVGIHAGEGAYALFKPILDAMREEFAAALQPGPAPGRADTSVAATALSYPGDVAVHEASGRVYIADSGHNRVVVAAFDGAIKQAIGDGVEGFVDGPAEVARFRQPQGIAVSDDGATLYVADTRNHAVRAVDTTTGEVRTLAGTGRQAQVLPRGEQPARETALASPWDVLRVGETLYISMAGIHQLWTLDLSTNTVQVFAGTSREGLDDGPRLSVATLAQPSGLASDGQYLYWVDPEASALRRVPLAGDGGVETLVGKGLFDWGDRDGTGTGARLQHPQGLAVTGGLVVVADTYNHRLRVVDPRTLDVRTLTGSGERGREDGAPGLGSFNEPQGLTPLGAGRLLLADSNNHALRIIDIGTGAVTTLRLTNLGVLGGAGGRVTRIQLPEQRIVPGAGTLRVTVRTPLGYRLNSGGPSRLAFLSSDAAVVEPGERELRWTTDAPVFSAVVPALLGPGTATLVARGEVYFCREGEEALCFIQAVEMSLPVRIDSGATAGELALEYEVPHSP